MAEGSSRQVTLLLVVLGLAAGAGTYNYQRNAGADAYQATREFQGLSEGELDELIAAYDSEVARLRLRLQQVKQSRALPQRGLPLPQGIEQFEQVQRMSAHLRAAGAKVAEREVTLDRLEEEMRIRNDRYFELRRFFKRVITI